MEVKFGDIVETTQPNKKVPVRPRSLAISKEFKCNPGKIPLDRNPYVQLDIDRFLGHLKSECEKGRNLLDNHHGTMYEEHPHLLKEVERQIDVYEGIIGTIEANSFK